MTHLSNLINLHCLLHSTTCCPHPKWPLFLKLQNEQPESLPTLANCCEQCMLSQEAGNAEALSNKQAHGHLYKKPAFYQDYQGSQGPFSVAVLTSCWFGIVSRWVKKIIKKSPSAVFSSFWPERGGMVQGEECC